MTTRLPPSTRPPGSGSAGQAQQPRRTRGIRPQPAEKPKPIKAGGSQGGEESSQSPEAQLWAGHDMDRSLEIRAADVEQRMAEIANSEAADAEEGKEHAADLRESNERSEKAKPGLFKVFGWQKPALPQQRAPGPAFKQAQGEPLRKPDALKQQGSTGTSQSRLQPVNTTAITASRLNAVGGVQQKLMGAMAHAERPPDAFALLKDAREKGVLFVEDALADGHSEDQEDPELAAAVEECIRLCFGVRGILRIGPGHNDKNEPIIVVATTHGFSDASLAKVPEQVHRFPTLIAIPFDLLPLKRER